MHERFVKILFSYYNHMLILARTHIHSFMIDLSGENNIDIELISAVTYERFYK